MVSDAPPPSSIALPDWSTLFELLPIGAYRSTVGGRILRANAALVFLNGYRSEAEIVGAVNDIASEWYVDPLRRAEFRRLLETNGRVRGFVSKVFRHATREQIWVSENAHVISDTGGNIVCFEGTVEEITSRMRTLQALEQSEATLRLIAQQLPGVVCLAHVTPDGTPSFHFISDGVQDLYGISPTEALRDGHVLQRMRHPEDAPRVQALLRDAERDGRSYTDEFRIVRPDGSVRWVQASSSPIRRGPMGDMRCGLILDITERRQTESLRAERDRAETARLTIAGLLARISHELRTPLNAMLGFAWLLARDPGLDARQQRFATESLNAGRHLLSLVDDVLDLGRAESGEFSLNIAPIDPATALAASHSLLAATAEAAGVPISLPAGPLPSVHADHQRLRQILTNLLSNAIKYNRPGGSVRVSAARVGGCVELAVADDGNGLTPDQQLKLFQPFERLGAERGPVAGTGLGLTLSLQLARAMSGDITVRSEPGKGSRFTLSLPGA